MALYKIEWSRSALKEFDKVPRKEKTLLISKILELANDPKPVGSKKLSGVENTFRIRQGTFRVVYRIEPGLLLILILRVAHRKEAYR